MLEFLRALFPSVRRTEDGASAVEYGLLVAGIAALVVAVVFLLGGVVSDSMGETCATINGNGTAATCT
jgi:pilus assembly protein Flp/PilA